MRTSGMIGVSGVFVTILLVTCIIPVNGLNETPLFDLSVDSANQESSLIDTIGAENEKPRIAVVKPIFTTTAYADAFYEFYRKHARSTEPFITTDLWYLNVTVKDDWGYTEGLADFLYGAKARIADLHIGESVVLINEIDVIMGALFDEGKRVYDVLILGFTEYVTIEEYNFYKKFVETGGTLIIMNACNFLAEVKYYPPVTPDDEGRISLVKGHGWEFNGTHAWKSVYHRWPEENRNWIGSNYWKYWWGTHYDFFRANTSHSISTYIRNHYGENVPTIYGAHEENKLENLTDTQIIGYWNFIDPSEAPNDPVAAYQHNYGNGTVFHTGIMASNVINEDEFLQAFLVSAVRIGILGTVGEWTFYKEIAFQASTAIFYENSTPIQQDGILFGVIAVEVRFNSSVIVQNRTIYSLSSVNLNIYRTYPGVTLAQSACSSMITEDSLNWSILVNTESLVDAVYVFAVTCRFTSVSSSPEHLNSTLMVSIHLVKNISGEVSSTLYLTLGFLAAIPALTGLFIAWKGKLNQKDG